VIVDLGLPDEDGKVFIRDMRNWSSAPVLVLSAREREVEKVEALNVGAGDYLTKPFGVPELIARVRAQLRRANLVTAGPASSVASFGRICDDLATYEVTRAGEQVHLTPVEFRLLVALIRGYGKVIRWAVAWRAYRPRPLSLSRGRDRCGSTGFPPPQCHAV
jgi:two-component system, OmpR family, KDP operon response regulator KdpE